MPLLFSSWFRATEAGNSTPRPLHLEYLDGELGLIALDLVVDIVSVDFDDQFVDPYLQEGAKAQVKVRQIDQQKLDSILNLIR